MRTSNDNYISMSYVEWNVIHGPLSANCAQIYKRLKGITAKHAMQSVITRFREQPGHDGIFFNVKVCTYLALVFE